jgi:hypothetical protein
VSLEDRECSSPYEDWMPPREVELAVRDVRVFVEKLRAVAC